MPASTIRICLIAASPSVIAGLKCAPEMIASVWISANRTNAWTSPTTAKSWNGWYAPTPGCMTGAGTNRTTDMVIAKTRPKVPMNSAI